MAKSVLVDLGIMEYRECWAVQRRVADKRRSAGLPDTLLAVQHPPVLTLGASFREANLLLTEDQYRDRGIDIVRNDRGGDVTFHGPDQLVLYPIFDLKEHGRDIHAWLRGLEEAVIQTIACFGLEGARLPPHTGVWVKERKIAAIGVKVSRWISTHGIALNCCNDLSPFDLIVPCGIRGLGVTSLTREVGREVTIQDALSAARSSFEKVFGLELKEISRAELEAELAA